MADIKTGHSIGIWHLLAGVLMLILGIYVFFHPVVTMVALALYLGIIFIVIGAGYFMTSFTFDSGWYMLVGLIDIFVGVIFISNLGITAESMPVIFALWCLAVGVIQLVEAFRFRQAGYPWGWTLGAGLVGIIFAFLILAYPVLGSVTITALMGAYIVLYGIIEIAEYVTGKRLIAA